MWDASGQCIGRLPVDRPGVLVYDVEDGSARAVVCDGSEGGPSV